MNTSRLEQVVFKLLGKLNYYLILRKITDDPVEGRNLFWSSLGWTLFGLGTLLVGGTVLQTYLVKVGLSNIQLGLISFSGGMGFTVGTLLLPGLADRAKKCIRAVALCMLPPIFLPLALIIINLGGPGLIEVAVVFWTLIMLSAFVQFVLAYQNMVSAGMWTLTFGNSTRGKAFGLQGIMVGIASIAMGSLSIKILAEMGYPEGFTLCFVGAIFLYSLSALTIHKLKPLTDITKPYPRSSVSPVKALRKLFSMRKFQILIVPNILRGVTTMGVVIFVMPVAIRRFNLPINYVGYVVISSAASAVFASLLITLFYKEGGAGRGCLLACCLATLGILGMVLSGRPLMFILFNTILMLGVAIEATLIPLGILEIAPKEVANSFFGARLLLTMVTLSFSSVLIGYLLDLFSPLWVFSGIGFLTFINGVLWLFSFPKAKD